MSVEKLVQNSVNEQGENVLTDSLSFVKIMNSNADALKTSIKLDLDTHNTPEFLAKAFKEQAANKISYITPGGPEDLTTYNEPSVLTDGIGQIYNKEVESQLEDPGNPENPDPGEDDNPILDKTALNAANAEVQKVLASPASYTFDSYDAFEEAYNIAKNLPEAKVTAINNALDLLVENSFTPPPSYPENLNKTALNQAISIADSKNEADYTSESWTNLQNAYTTAKAMPENTQSAIDAKTTATNSAIDVLVEENPDSGDLLEP